MVEFKVDQGEEGQKTELPAIRLIHALGYDYLPNFEINKERKAHFQALLYDRLRNAIKNLNNLDEEGIESAVYQIEEDFYPSNLDLVDANERVRIKLVGLSRSGGIDQPITVKQFGADGVEYITVRLFDFENPENNDFLITNQFELTGLKSKIEPDIVVFVNGIPLVVIECKKPSSHDYLKEAWESNLEKYQTKGLGYEKLFFYNHIIIATCDIAAKYGTVGSGPNNYSKWTSLHDMTLEELEKLTGRTPTAQDILLAGMLNKKTLFEMLKNFVIYDVENNKKVKKVAKHQQYRVVSKSIQRLREGKEIIDKGGVIWHTQGSGKSLSMVWFATHLWLKFEDPPILIVTDRRQLDRQIHGTFKSCGFPEPIKAKSIKHLEELLQHPQGKTIMTTIQKFGTPGESFHTDERIIVLVDEGHRTQYGWNAVYMRTAMPNAVFFAFSGTPIDKRNRSTYKEFGPLIDKYSFEESKNDGATLKVKYEGRHPELGVEGTEESIEEIFDRVFAKLPKEEKAKLKAQYVTKGKIAEAPSRIREICQDLVKHYTTYIEPNGYKGMIVASSREAAVLYKRELDKIGAPLSKVIMTSEFDEKGKDGASWNEYYLPQEEREREAERFKDPNDPTKLLIVVDMLLVGYDVPIVQVMYLDRGLKEHSLLQAMARVNRLYDSTKEYGLLVDYIGITKNLQKALEIFEKDDIQGAFETLDGDLIELESRHKELMSVFGDLNREDDSALLLKFEPADMKDKLEYAFKMFAKALDAVLPKKEAEQYKDDFKYACSARAKIRTYYFGDKPSIREYGKKVQQLIDDHIRATGISELMNPREITYENFLAFAAKPKDQNARTALVKNKTMQVIRELSSNNPAYYEKLRQRLEKIIKDEKERRVENANYFEFYGQIYNEAVSGRQKRQEELGINDEFQLAVFDFIQSEIDDENQSKKYAQQITQEIKEESKILDWKNKLTVENKMYLIIYDMLDSTKFSEEIRDNLSNKIIELARNLL